MENNEKAENQICEEKGHSTPMDGDITCWQVGFNAFNNSQEASSNPYLIDSTAYDAWKTGYAAAALAQKSKPSPRDQGYAAFDPLGAMKPICPHPHATEEWYEWNIGYDNAVEQHLKLKVRPSQSLDKASNLEDTEQGDDKHCPECSQYLDEVDYYIGNRWRLRLAESAESKRKAEALDTSAGAKEKAPEKMNQYGLEVVTVSSVVTVSNPEGGVQEVAAWHKGGGGHAPCIDLNYDFICLPSFTNIPLDKAEVIAAAIQLLLDKADEDC